MPNPKRNAWGRVTEPADKQAKQATGRNPWGREVERPAAKQVTEVKPTPTPAARTKTITEAPRRSSDPNAPTTTMKALLESGYRGPYRLVRRTADGRWEPVPGSKLNRGPSPVGVDGASPVTGWWPGFRRPGSFCVPTRKRSLSKVVDYWRQSAYVRPT